MAQNSTSQFLERFSVKQIVLLSLILFIGFGMLWWRVVYSNPERVFNAMLENSMRLQGVTRHVAQSGAGQDLDQYSWLTNSSAHISGSRTVLSQSQGSTRVETESIGTPTGDFVRYNTIDTTQTRQDGKPLDFSAILGVWGSNDSLLDGGVTNGELYGESVLGIVPIGYLSAPQREKLLGLIHQQQVYEVDYNKVKREVVDGRPRYTYTVMIEPAKYVGLLKEFAGMAGLNNLDALDPESYAGAEKLSIDVTVDVWSRQLTRVAYGGGARIEEFSAHNVVRNVDVPTDTIPVDELQRRLQELQ